jgi:hypothetical protein
MECAKKKTKNTGVHVSPLPKVLCKRSFEEMDLRDRIPFRQKETHSVPCRIIIDAVVGANSSFLFSQHSPGNSASPMPPTALPPPQAQYAISIGPRGQAAHDTSHVELYIRGIMWRTHLCGVD